MVKSQDKFQVYLLPEVVERHTFGRGLAELEVMMAWELENQIAAASIDYYLLAD